ncbi:Zinc finger BED domain-containing protein RICESLEEPER 2 [Linum perenne]
MKEKAKCRTCGKEYFADSNGGTSTLKRHALKCKSAANANLDRVTEEHNSCDGSSSNNITQEGYREKLAKAIIAHDYSFSWVEHEGNRDIHRYLNATVNPISRNTIKSDILIIHGRMKEELKCALREIPGRICLTSDMWTSLTTRSFLCLTAHYVDKNWKLNSKLLNFSHVQPPHTALELKTVIYRMLKEWDIDNKIFTITLDNASNMTNIHNELRDQLNGQHALVCNGKYFHIRCCGHILNLIVQDGLKVIRDGVKCVRESVKYVDGSEARKIKFKECVEQAGMKCTKGLWLDVPTRWNSTYMMLERALFYKQAFVNLTRVDKDYKDCPSLEDWEKISVLANILQLFDEITKLFSGSNYPTSNLFFENFGKSIFDC